MKQEREQAIYALYNQLKSEPGAMSTACESVVMERFGIYARGTVWKICQRVGQRIKEGERASPGKSLSY